MLNDHVIINKKHEEAARLILDHFRNSITKKYIVTISGEVASGKCEISQELSRLLRLEGYLAKILLLDDYYKVPPDKRTEWRKEHGFETIGYEEYDWQRINKNIIDFKNSKKSSVPCVDLATSQVDELITDFAGIDILIINGLYALKIEEANLKVFVELTYKETLQEQIAEKKEVLDDFRMKVLEQEHKVIQSMKHLADFYVDFETSPEAFHL